MKNILVLGGTGAMGKPLVDLLSKDNKVFVTTRISRESQLNIEYLVGNAQNNDFLLKVLSMCEWDAVVDFMVRSEENLKSVLSLFFANTKQYIFISSCRVYSQTEQKITEETPRLLDVSTDVEYLKTNEYALAKAREENVLFNSGETKFTIIRPTITYNTHRLQLGVLEKENWLYRALHGRAIVFSDDVSSKLTTMTLGDDVASGIASIIGKEASLGKAFHITYPESRLWSEILSIYLNVLEKYLGRKVPVVMTAKSTNLKFPHRVYQLIYSRYFNRTFDNSRISEFCDISKFTLPECGLTNCLEEFLKTPKFGDIAWDIEAVNDKITGERTPLSEIPTCGGKLTYLAYRYDLMFLLKIEMLFKKIIFNIKRFVK